MNNFIDPLKAIDFAKEQSDDDLWEDLLKYSETRPGNSISSKYWSLLMSGFNSVYSRTIGECRCRDRP